MIKIKRKNKFPKTEIKRKLKVSNLKEPQVMIESMSFKKRKIT